MNLNIEVFGVGSARDVVLLRSVEMALQDLDLSCSINYITDLESFLSFKLPAIPALTINRKVVSAGRVPAVSELRHYLSSELPGKEKVEEIPQEAKSAEK